MVIHKRKIIQARILFPIVVSRWDAASTCTVPQTQPARARENNR